jgi:hypothetical protein
MSIILESFLDYQFIWRSKKGMLEKHQHGKLQTWYNSKDNMLEINKDETRIVKIFLKNMVLIILKWLKLPEIYIKWE